MLEVGCADGAQVHSGFGPRQGDEPCAVDYAEALRYLGYAGQEIAPELSVRIDEAVSLCERVSSPRFMWRAFPLEDACDAQGESVLRLEGSTIELPGGDIRRHLDGAVACVAMACTLGLSNEREARRMSAVDPVASTLFSAAGSSLVEVLADRCSADVLAHAGACGLTTGSRYSPGYGDLPLGVQPRIVAALGADKRMGMTPLDGGFVVPVKSVTALIGLFDTPHEENRRSCAGCVMGERCMLKRTGMPCYR